VHQVQQVLQAGQQVQDITQQAAVAASVAVALLVPQEV
jgi:uncharacterized membrane protein YadS